MTEAAHNMKWIKWEHLGEGAWQIRCRLCGKRFVRTFRDEDDDEAKRQASDHVGEHLDSEWHAAAIEVYRAPVRKPSREEELLAQIFGDGDSPTSEQRRRQDARAAAEAVRFGRRYRGRTTDAHMARIEEKEARDRARIMCALCGQAVSMKDERADERATLPSGAMVHVRCVESD